MPFFARLLREVIEPERRGRRNDPRPVERRCRHPAIQDMQVPGAITPDPGDQGLGVDDALEARVRNLPDARRTIDRHEDCRRIADDDLGWGVVNLYRFWLDRLRRCQLSRQQVEGHGRHRNGQLRLQLLQVGKPVVEQRREFGLRQHELVQGDRARRGIDVGTRGTEDHAESLILRPACLDRDGSAETERVPGPAIHLGQVDFGGCIGKGDLARPWIRLDLGWDRGLVARTRRAGLSGKLRIDCERLHRDIHALTVAYRGILIGAACQTNDRQAKQRCGEAGEISCFHLACLSINHEQGVRLRGRRLNAAAAAQLRLESLKNLVPDTVRVAESPVSVNW